MQPYPDLPQEQLQEPKFKDYFEILLKRRNIITNFFVAVLILAAIYNIRSPNIYAASAQILIQDPDRSFLGISENQPSLDYSTKSQVEIMTSLSVVTSVLEKLDLVSKYPDILGSDIKTASRRVQGMVHLKQVAESRVFYVTIMSPNPSLCAELANGLVDEYIEKDVMTYFLSSKDLLKKMFPEGGRVKVENFYGKLKELSKDEMVLSLPTVVKNPKMVELKTKRDNLEKDLMVYAKKYTDKHPKVINTKKNIQLVKEQTRSTANDIVNELKDATSGKYQVSNIKVIEYAEVPESPVGPNRKKNFLLVTIMAFFAGCGIALFVDYLDNTVKTQDDIERHIRLPYLGYVPLMKDRAEPLSSKSQRYVIISPEEHKSPLLEAFRNVRTSIVFSAPPGALRSLLITSALPKEGKSTISFNLAIAMSSDGSRTLLVDGDMRRPSLHKMAGLKNQIGLSNYLTAPIKLEEVLQETRFPNLKLLTCGPIPPNPSELFGSYRMAELLDEAKGRFDRIIFDGAPIFGISDSVVLAKALDGVIQVIRFGKVTWDIANKSKQRLQNLGVKIIGIIINGVDTKKESYYYKYYDYRYHKYYE